MGACVTKSDPKVESIMSLETDEVEMQKSAQELRQSYEKLLDEVLLLKRSQRKLAYLSVLLGERSL